jgi:hypothetical protein
MGEEQVGIRAWLERITADYREMPGLSLSKAQMRRLWGLEAVVCDAVVDALVAAGVFRRTEHDTFVANA